MFTKQLLRFFTTGAWWRIADDTVDVKVSVACLGLLLPPDKMKFRAELLDTLLLTHVLTAFAHLGDSCCLHLSPTHLRLVMNSLYGETGGEYAIFHCEHESLFESYRIESKSGNEILIHVAIQALLTAVKVTHTHTQTKTSTSAT